ncbi:MAG: MBL fold metallo-hydrolase [Myxococcota bacterium]|nr:MBL fold metallo-hydrolase [Myxococcota bacterium]
MRASVLTSGIWQTSSTILEHGGTSLVVDPAYFPRELEALAAAASNVQAVVFTHGHWDHVMGHATFDAPVWLGQRLHASIDAGDPRVARWLEDAREFDSRWYVPRAGYAWPARRRGLADGDRVELAGSPIHVLELAGHSFDGIALVIEELGLLLPGDHLSPCEIPFVEDAHAYRRTLERLIVLLKELREVIPGHGPRMPATEALAIARADLDYVDRLLDVGARHDFTAAAAMALPRAATVVGMRDHHRENLRKLGVAVG